MATFWRFREAGLDHRGLADKAIVKVSVILGSTVLNGHPYTLRYEYNRKVHEAVGVRVERGLLLRASGPKQVDIVAVFFPI